MQDLECLSLEEGQKIDHNSDKILFFFERKTDKTSEIIKNINLIIQKKPLAKFEKENCQVVLWIKKSNLRKDLEAIARQASNSKISNLQFFPHGV